MYIKRKKNYEKHNVWRSYSDMLSGLLLLFILVMCISFMQAQKNYQERISEETAHQLTQAQLLAELAQRESEVASQQSTLDEQNALLATQQEDLNSQSALLATQQQSLDSQSALLASQAIDLANQAALLETQQTQLATQQAELAEKNSLMAAQQAALDEQTALMTAQQQKIEQIIGVKADLISALKQQFEENSLNVTIDDTDGSIILDSNVLFSYNENVLTEEGMQVLKAVLPVYCKVLLNDAYHDYLAEIRIDGYTDTQGDYLYNLQLSQERALAVANYLMSTSSEFLTAEEITVLKENLTANGHSMSNPVLGADGAVDMDASRRVEIKFSLKDEEMINEMKAILDNN